jgi:hypothetical protein
MTSLSDKSAIKQYNCIQLFDRNVLSILWANRNKLDSEQVGILKVLYDDKVRGTDKSKPVIYKLSRNIPGKLGYGRYYGNKGSIETLKKNIRASLCSKYYIDIDISNCHPCLIVQLAENKYNLNMPNLKQYVQNRNGVIETYNINKDDAKTFIFKILYNGVLDSFTPNFFKQIQKEMKLFTTVLINSNSHTQLFEFCKRNKDNVYGSFASFVIQTEERKCLDAMIEYLEQNRYSVDVLAYDGCMIRKADVNLTDIEIFVLNQTGYRITLAQKEMIPMNFEEMEFVTDDDAILAMESDEVYESMKIEWEKTHFYFKPGNTVVEIDDTGSINHYSITHASETFNILKLGIDSDANDIHFLKRWRNDSSRRIVDRLVYKYTDDCLPNEASLFQGFSYRKITQPACPEAVGMFENILRAVCGDDEAVFVYVRNTFAHMIQVPFEKTGVCTIFASKTQGTGKDTAMLWISKVLGNHVAHYTDDDTFWGQFDTRKEGAVLMYLEEAGSAANKAKSNALKARITCEDFTVNPKGLKAYSVKNIARYFMTTNETCPVKFEESDRRFLIVTPSDRLASSKTGDHGFWTKVYKELGSNPGWLRAVGEYLESVDVSEWNPRIIPETEIRQLAADLVRETAERQFLIQWEGTNVPASQLYSEYKTFCIQNDLRYKTSLISFGMAISNSNLIQKTKTEKSISFSKLSAGDLET